MQQSPCATPLIPIFGPIATVIVGLLVAYIAWQQWKISQAKLRLDLFDRRYKVYDATRTFIGVALRKTNFDDSDLFEFYRATSDAGFLFKADVVNYLKEVSTHANEMRLHHELYHPTPASETERVAHINAVHERKQWLIQQTIAMSKVFVPYLDFSHIR
jgi:hypothetical protein